MRAGQRSVLTDSIGKYECLVPADQIFDVWTIQDSILGVSIAGDTEQTSGDLTGKAFSGQALWNPFLKELDVFLSGNVPETCRFR